MTSILSLKGRCALRVCVCVCVTGLWREHHDQIASFMAAMGPRGAEEALRLSGLSLRQELRLASRAGQLRRAQHCLEALAWGSGDRATLNAFPLWQSHTVDTLLGGGSGGDYTCQTPLLFVCWLLQS